MKIAVFGSGTGSSELKEDVKRKAFQVGKLIAEKGAILITGGCSGLPYEAAKGAKSAGGHTVAYSPGTDIDDHKNRFKNPTDAYDEFIFVPKKYGFDIPASMKYRNVISCNDSDACIIIGGRMGTLDEFTHMYEMGKIIGILKGTGGVTTYIETVIEVADKDCGATVKYDTDPIALVDKISR